MKLTFLTIIFTLIIFNVTDAAVFKSKQSGYWGDSNTWQLFSGTDADGIPDNFQPEADWSKNDTVIIENGHIVTLGQSATVNYNCFTTNITINSGGTLEGSNRILWLFGNFTNNGNVSGSITFYVFRNTALSSTSNFTINYFKTYRTISVTIITGTTLTFSTLDLAFGATLNNNGTITTNNLTYSDGSSPSTINNNSGGVLNMITSSTSINLNSSTNSTVNISGGNADIPNWSYYNLNLNAVSTIKRVTSNLIVANNLTLNANNQMNLNNQNLTIGGNLTIIGSISNPANITFNGSSSSQTIANSTSPSTTISLKDLTCSNSNGLIMSGGSINLNGNLNLTNGNLSLGSRSINIGGNISASGTGNLASGAGETNTITLNSSPAQTISNSSGSALNFYNLICNKTSATPTITVSSGNINVNNNLTVTAGTLALGNSNLMVSGNLTHFGTISQTSGTVSITGTSTCSGTSAFTVGTLNQTGNFTVSSGTLNLGSTTANLSGFLSNSGTISSTGTLNIAGALTFNGSGNLASNNTSTIVLNGSGAAQTITIPNAITVPFHNLTCSNPSGVSLSVVGSGKCTLKNSLIVNSGNLNAGTDLLTMLSDASITAIIGNSSGTISGRVIIQRYMAPCVYRKFDLGSPVTSATIDDWDNELYMSIGASDDGSSPAYLGGDGSAGGTSSVFIYNNQLNSTKKYVAVTTGTTLTPGRGYQTLIADDLTGFPGRVIDTRGTPNMGSVSLPVFMTGTDGFNLVSNPFQAEIDWALVTKSNISNTVYFLEYNGTKSTYLTARVNPKINPGLGFMCVATGANPSVTVTQSSKTNNTTSAFGARLASYDDDNFDLRIRISSPITSEYNEADLYFDKKAASGFDFKDFLFGESLIEEAPVITFIDSGKHFVRNYFNNELETVTFPLAILTPVNGNYSIDLEGLYESYAYQDAYLINNLTKEKFSLTNNKSASIYFDKVENEQFQLVLSKKLNVEDVFNSTSNSISVFATSNNLVIKNSENQMQQFDLKVYNVLGQMLFEQSNIVSGKSEVNISTEFLKSDIYIVKLKTTEGNELTKKVVFTK